MTSAIILALSAVIGIGFFAHIVSCVAVIWRYRGAGRTPPAMANPALTVLRPVCGLDPGLEQTLASSFPARQTACEVIFCVAKADDPAIPLIHKLIAAHPETPARLLTGDNPISGNPKVNNLAKGWAAATSNWIAMVDSNVLLPQNYIEELFSSWREDTGLVTSPPIGIRSEGVWAEVECAVLNGYQARWQLAGDQLGNGFAQGKVLFWRRDILDKAGGLVMLGGELAEDVAATKLVRGAGYRVRVVKSPFPQPVFRRRFCEVWLRQIRWARVRRAGFPWLFALEIFTGGFLPLTAMALLTIVSGVSILTVPAALAIWYGLEWSVAISAGWSASLTQVPIWMFRDALIPAVWLVAFGARGFVWRGSRMEPGDRPLVAAG